MSGIQVPGDDDKVVPDAQDGEVGHEDQAVKNVVTPETPHPDEIKETVPETDEEIRAVNDEIHKLVLDAAKAPDYSASLETLGECKNFEALFDAVNKEANYLLSKEPAVQIVIQRIADSIGPENFTPEIRNGLKTAVETNDCDKMKRIIYGLVENAIYYNKGNNFVDITIEGNDKEIKVEVKDSGIGIDKKETSKICERFFRGKDSSLYHADGLGISLFISKSLIEQSGGKFLFKSKKDKGSIFSFSLPITDIK